MLVVTMVVITVMAAAIVPGPIVSVLPHTRTTCTRAIAVVTCRLRRVGSPTLIPSFSGGCQSERCPKGGGVAGRNSREHQLFTGEGAEPDVGGDLSSSITLSKSWI